MKHKMDKNTKLLMKSDSFIFETTENTGFEIIRGFDKIEITFTNVHPQHSREENQIIKDVKLNNNYITVVAKTKKNNNEGEGFVFVNSDGLGFWATQDINLLRDFVKIIENKGIEYIKDLRFKFWIRNPEKQKTSLKIIHSFYISYRNNISD